MLCIVETTDCTFDSSKINTSPSLNLISFLEMYDIWESFILSATIATAPEVCPTNLSPIMRSLVLLLGPLIVDSITVGAKGWIFGLDAS